ncbi:MAG: hypothetical protein JSR41_10015 [Proteobacteria bacterium]|nr:hypothetical protein [Pseudomonadota bacterium]
MTRLTLQPSPTFEATVKIPVPGAEPVEVKFNFKHRTKAELKAFTDSMGDREDVDQVMGMATAWDLADAFNAENVGLLVSNYFAAARAIFFAYIDELTQAKEKN